MGGDFNYEDCWPKIKYLIVNFSFVPSNIFFCCCCCCRYSFDSVYNFPFKNPYFL